MLYDVYFRIKYPACMVVEASSEDEAREIAEDLLINMDDDELMHRLIDAMNYYGFEIENVEED